MSRGTVTVLFRRTRFPLPWLSQQVVTRSLCVWLSVLSAADVMHGARRFAVLFSLYTHYSSSLRIYLMYKWTVSHCRFLKHIGKPFIARGCVGIDGKFCGFSVVRREWMAAVPPPRTGRCSTRYIRGWSGLVDLGWMVCFPRPKNWILSGRQDHVLASAEVIFLISHVRGALKNRK